MIFSRFDLIFSIVELVSFLQFGARLFTNDRLSSGLRRDNFFSRKDSSGEGGASSMLARASKIHALATNLFRSGGASCCLATSIPFTTFLLIQPPARALSSRLKNIYILSQPKEVPPAAWINAEMNGIRIYTHTRKTERDYSWYKKSVGRIKKNDYIIIDLTIIQYNNK